MPCNFSYLSSKLVDGVSYQKVTKLPKQVLKLEHSIVDHLL